MAAKDRYLKDLADRLERMPLPMVQPPAPQPVAVGADSITTLNNNRDRRVRDAVLTAGLHPDHAHIDQLRVELDRGQHWGYLCQAAALRTVVGLLLEAYAAGDADLLRARMTSAAEYWEATSVDDPAEVNP